VRVSGPAAAAATAGLVVALDQATKQLAATNIAPNDQVAVIPGLDLTSTRNTGVAFGALEGGGVLVAILIGVSLTLLLAYFVANRNRPWLWLPVGMLLGWPAFNVADSCIVVGVLVLLWVVERSPQRSA
jgi:signal peptidase II